ncbi:hypothetical protein GALMADRAFT_242908, partial [Galerina marginata CBS 339.88]
MTPGSGAVQTMGGMPNKRKTVREPSSSYNPRRSKQTSLGPESCDVRFPATLRAERSDTPTCELQNMEASLSDLKPNFVSQYQFRFLANNPLQ